MAIQDVRRFLFGVLLCAAVPISFQAAAADYKLGPQDKVRIKVYEWPALSDDLAVGDDGTLALPLVGTLKADGISVADLAKEISSRLQKKENLREPPYVSVDILQYRPFYVLGDVQHPGEYAYRPGTRILTALSIAGGAYRGSDFQALRAERDAILSRGSLNIYEGKRRALLLRLARLESETRELAIIEVNLEEPGELAGVTSAELARETSILTARKTAFDNQKASLHAQVETYAQEIGGLEARIESLQKQQKSVQRELEAGRILEEKGLALMPRQATLERLSAQIEGDQRDVEVLITRARQSIIQTELALDKATDDRKKDIATEIQQVLAELVEVQSEIATHEELIREAELSGAAVRGVVADQRSMRFRYQIVREDSTGVHKFQVDDDARVEPGDVISVERVVPESGSAGGLRLGGSGSGMAHWRAPPVVPSR
ncbi:polysaccharide biosynthesis/export family protein [Mesorhizobium sp.]|uniref:polysaccharide biosynthesis/export family protein n=1 Tax=Mesorhizobium sp. TaxID=1871066 RepID=UPI000FE61DE9|nr:polysaccharide biosynthesis/export family protein [Mesorhizobium sp.]RWP69995.1 MAG: hypothetical protein EOR07_01410 [Mesorhizobium sp.]